MGENRQNSNLLSGENEKAKGEIKGRRGKTKELTETFLLPGAPGGEQVVGRKNRTCKVKGNGW